MWQEYLARILWQELQDRDKNLRHKRFAGYVTFLTAIATTPTTGIATTTTGIGGKIRRDGTRYVYINEKLAVSFSWLCEDHSRTTTPTVTQFLAPSLYEHNNKNPGELATILRSMHALLRHFEGKIKLDEEHKWSYMLIWNEFVWTWDTDKGDNLIMGPELDITILQAGGIKKLAPKKKQPLPKKNQPPPRLSAQKKLKKP